jgi:hypothetical protein
LTNVIGVTGTVAKEIAAKQPELPLKTRLTHWCTANFDQFFNYFDLENEDLLEKIFVYEFYTSSPTGSL